MDVVKFKRTGDVYFVQYEENQDIKTLKTEDEPEAELSAAMDNTALALLRLFNISDVTCKLQAIEWKDGEKAGSKCILLSGESQFGQFKMALLKVSTQETETPEEGIYDPGDLKNQYNQAVDILRAEAKRFVEGSRRQRVLPFKEEVKEGGKRKRRGIIGAVADSVGTLFADKNK
jgi:hypothetical protein